MDINLLDILKWIGIVLAAGFVGYFGRYLAMLIIARMHKKGPGDAPPAEPAKETPAQGVSPDAIKLGVEKQKAKAEKKKAKAEAKKAKKEQK